MQPLKGKSEAMRASVVGWATSDAMRSLATESGWSWPQGSPLEIVAALAALSDDWDFRNARERDQIPRGDVAINGRRLQSDLVIAAARSLGLVDSSQITGEYDHLVILSGMVRACLNRAVHARHLLGDDVAIGHMHVLTGFRLLGTAERDLLETLGLPRAMSEHVAAALCAVEAFGADLEASFDNQLGDADDSLEERSVSSTQTIPIEGSEITIHRCASSDPVHRRANTGDQMDHLAEACSLGEGSSVLFVTTQIYVPYQRFEAWRRLAVPLGTRVEVCGVDAANAFTPLRDFGPADYLQEVRSAILAAERLLADLEMSAAEREERSDG